MDVWFVVVLRCIYVEIGYVPAAVVSFTAALFRNRVFAIQVSTSDATTCLRMQSCRSFPSETVSWRDCPGRTDGVPEIDLLAVDFHAWLMPWVVQLYNSCCGFFIAIFRFCIYGCCCGEWFNRIFCACNILIVWDSIYVDSSLFEENN